jgi:hypothetical protein
MDEPEMLQEIAKNLVSLNEIITEMTAKVSDEPELTALVRDTLREHSWALGFEFQGEQPPADRCARTYNGPYCDNALAEFPPEPELEPKPNRKRHPEKWVVWDWDARSKLWLAVDSGSEKDMTAALERKRSAAARLMPSARFTMTPAMQPPQEAPE